jgi:hypothetical protein
MRDDLLERASERIKRSRALLGDKFVYSRDAMLVLQLAARVLELQDAIRSARSLDGLRQSQGLSRQDRDPEISQ